MWQAQTARGETARGGEVDGGHFYKTRWMNMPPS
jgi:hypothetical protein